MEGEILDVFHNLPIDRPNLDVDWNIVEIDGYSGPPTRFTIILNGREGPMFRFQSTGTDGLMHTTQYSLETGINENPELIIQPGARNVFDFRHGNNNTVDIVFRREAL